MGLPAIENHVHQCRGAVSIASAVSGYVTPDVMLQIETGDIQGAIQALGGDSSTSNVVDLVRVRLGRSLQEAQMRVQLNRGNREAWISRVEQLQRDIGLVNDRFRSILNDDCSICMATFSNPVLTPCHHVFCIQCIVPWFQHSQTCPQCRTPLRPDQLTTLCSEAPTDPSLERAPAAHTTQTRMEHMERILLERRPNQRILIFSEYDTSLDTIQSVLGSQPFGVIQGHSSTRARSIEKFKTGELPILLLNSRMNGAGIDLPETTDIILFHVMSPAIEEQAIARGQRMGRTSTLHVHRFA
jgi:SNF2 family DNA or RNA helicase